MSKPMTVKQLRDALAQFDDDMLVLVPCDAETTVTEYDPVYEATQITALSICYGNEYFYEAWNETIAVPDSADFVPIYAVFLH